MAVNQDFRVSVCMLTYNHEKFIAQAIEGVMMQRTDFEVDLIIGEDCSPDNTRKICIEYEQKYKGRIKLRLPEKNLGGMTNFIQNLDRCTTGYKYVAMCEGDDYWIDPNKLQKQIDYLEAHPESGLVYTDVKLFDEAKQDFIPNKPRFVTDESRVIPELIKSKYIEFPSIVVRADLLQKILGILDAEWQGKVIGDTRLILEFAQHSKIGYLPEQTTVYRIVPGSASHPKTVDKLLFASNDTYQCRKVFVHRYGLDKRLLGLPVCNFNRGMIHAAYAQKNYRNVLKLLAAIKVKDTFLYCDFKTFRQKMDAKMMLKFVASLSGLMAIKRLVKRK